MRSRIPGVPASTSTAVPRYEAIAADAPDRDLRLAAAERAATMALPSAELEVWRYSRIGELDLAAFTPAAVQSTVKIGRAHV